MGQDIQKIVEACDEEEMYYVLGSGSISDEDYDKVKTSPYFLGSVGPMQRQIMKPATIWQIILQMQIPAVILC